MFVTSKYLLFKARSFFSICTFVQFWFFNHSMIIPSHYLSTVQLTNICVRYIYRRKPYDFISVDTENFT